MSEAQVMLESFNNEINAISSAIDQIEGNIGQVDEKYNLSQKRHVSQADRKEIGAELSEILGQTTQLAQAVRRRLRRIADENEEFAKDYPEHGATLKIRVTSHQGVTQTFMDSMRKLEDVQERQHDAARVGVERELRKLNPDAKEEDIERALQQCEANDETFKIDESPLLCQLPEEERNRITDQLMTLGDRNKNIRDLEQSVVDLHQMFTDMKLLVDQQGELLNTIEYNVQETRGRAEAGMNELIQAHDFQRRAVRKKWYVCLLVIVCVALAIIIIFIVYGRKWFGSSAATAVTESGPGHTPPDSEPPSGEADSPSVGEPIDGI